MRAWFALLLLWIASPAWARTLAVLPLEAGSSTEATKGLGRALSGMLISDLSMVDGLTLVERDQVDQLLKEIDLSKTGYLDPKTAQKLGKGAGAEWSLIGSWSVVDTTFVMDARAVEVQSGKVLFAVDASGTLDDFVGVEKDLIDQLLPKLEVELSGSTKRKILAAAPTENFEAFSAYGNGLEAEFEGELEAARAKFKQATQLDPAFTAAQTRLTAMKATFARMESDRQQSMADTRTTELQAALAKTPTEMDRTGPEKTLDGRLRLALRFSILNALGRHCEAAEEMGHFLARNPNMSHGAAHPVPYNRLHLLAYDIGLYPEEPKPWSHGTVMPPRAGYRSVVDRAPRTHWAPTFAFGTLGSLDKTESGVDGWVEATLACDVDADAWVAAMATFRSALKPHAAKPIHNPDQGLPTSVQLDLLEAELRARRDGMSAEVESLIQTALAAKLAPDEAFKVQAKGHQITLLAGVMEQQKRALMGLKAPEIRRVLDGVLAKDPAVVNLQGGAVCDAVFAQPRQFQTAVDRFDPAQAWSVSNGAGLVRAMEAAGCVAGVDGWLTSPAEVLAWAQTMPDRRIDPDARCTEAFKTLKAYEVSAGSPNPASQWTAIHGVISVAVSSGCASLR